MTGTTADAAVLARRFLHVNLNTADGSAASRFYVDGLGLKLRMKTDPDAENDGKILGLTGVVRCETSFYYDTRGARTSCAVEVIDWFDPAVATPAHPGPTGIGLSGLGFRVGDRDAVVARLTEAQGTVIATDVPGTITPGPTTLVEDGDGVLVEIADLADPDDTSAVHFAGVRVNCSDIHASVAYYEKVGFARLGEIEETTVGSSISGDTAGGADVTVLTCSVGLAEDRDSTSIRLIQWPDAVAEDSARPANRRGLYRCALRVENTETAMAATPADLPLRGPIWCPLPGTPIEGLNIAFLDDPDGVVLEYVERPLSNFQ